LGSRWFECNAPRLLGLVALCIFAALTYVASFGGILLGFLPTAFAFVCQAARIALLQILPPEASARGTIRRG